MNIQEAVLGILNMHFRNIQSLPDGHKSVLHEYSVIFMNIQLLPVSIYILLFIEPFLMENLINSECIAIIQYVTYE